MNKKRTVPLYVTAVFFIIAAVSCVYGVYSGETRTVSKKASNICMECIGIG